MKTQIRPSEYGSRARGYVVALTLTAIATLLQIGFAPILDGARYLVLIGAIVITATLGGFGPALLSIALSSVAAIFFIMPPTGAFRIQNPADVVQLTLFVAFMILLAWVIARYQEETVRLRGERVQALEEMATRVEAERRRLADIVASVPGVVWEASGTPERDSQRINYVSEHVTRMLGYTVEEWLATPNFWLTIVHPDDRENAARHARDHFQTGDFRANTFRWMTKDGRAIWVESHSMVVKNEQGNAIGMRGVTLDMSARRRAEEALRFLARVSELVTSSLDMDATIQTAAAAALPILGELCVIDLLEDGQLRRAAVKHIDPSLEYAARLLQSYNPGPDLPYGAPAAIRSSTVEVVGELPPEVLAKRGSDDSHREVIARLGTQSYIVVPLIARSGTVGALTLSSRETNRYDEAAVELAGVFGRRVALAIENAQLHTLAVEANRAKDEFLATVSHELRTPMTATLGWVRMLTIGSLDEETVKIALDAIDRSTQARARLIEDILDVSSIISGKFRLEVGPVDLGTVITNAIDTLRPAATAKQITIEIEFEFAPRVTGDADRLQQIVWNLVSNAIKFVPRGGHIGVGLHRGSDAARIVVSDNGPGIDPAFLPHVFERFRQGDSGIDRAHGGLGLGLAIVRHLAELHGGSVSVASDGLGHGVTFTVELPLAPAQRAGENQELPFPMLTPPSSPQTPLR